jgi:hypothetical protein
MCTHFAHVPIPNQAFFLSFCDVATMANHLQEDIARFGYRSEINVLKKFKNPAIHHTPLIGFGN